MIQDDVIKLAREAGLYQDINVSFHQALKNFYNLAAAHEREACAKVCDELPAPNFYSASDKGMWDIASMECATAIRARGKHS